MNFLDIILASILLYGLIKGLWKGFFVEFASLISLLLGIFIAVKFSGFTADFIRDTFSSDSEYLEIISFGITFVLVIIGVILSAKAFTKIANFAGLGWINRLLGGIFGLLRMIFILSISLHFFEKININRALVSEEKLEQSVLYNPITQVSEYTFPTLSEWFDKAKQKVDIPINKEQEREQKEQQ